MTVAAMGIVFLLLPTTTYAAPHSASKEDRERLLALVREGRDAMAASEAKRKSAFNLALTDPEAAQLELADADKEQAVMTAMFNEAIRLAEKAYGVGPSRRSGVVAGGPATGVRTDWAPEYLPPPLKPGLLEKPRQAKFFHPGIGMTVNIHEVVAYGRLGEDEGARAATFVDGKVVVTMNTFLKVIRTENPGYIASALHHEAVHFDELTGGGGWQSAQSREAKAYAADFATAEVVGLTASERLLAASRVARGRLSDFLGAKSPYPDSAEQDRAKGLYAAEQLLIQDAARTGNDIAARAEAARLQRQQTAPLPAPWASEPGPVSAPEAEGAGGLTIMAAAACAGDSEVARNYGYDRYRVMGAAQAPDLEAEAARVEARGAKDARCIAGLLRVLGAKLREGRLLSMDELLSTARTPAETTDDIVPERNTGRGRGSYDPCIEDGNTCLKR